MTEQTFLHHFIPKIFANFAERCGAFTKGRHVSRARQAELHFASLGRIPEGKVSPAKIPFTEVPEGKLPAIYFTRTGQHPVVIQEQTHDGFSIRLWDGRESVCERDRLEKTLEPVGYFLPDENAGKETAFRKLIAALVEEKRFIGIGLANGAVNISLLIVFVFVLFHAFRGAFPAAQMTSPALALAGIFAAVLSTFGFLQARFLINAWFSNLSDTNRSRELQMPPPFPIQSLTSAEPGRIMMEAASAPCFLAAGAVFVGWDITAVASWGVLLACVIPAFLFLSRLPAVFTLWKQALWFFGEQPSIFEEDTDEEEIVDSTAEVEESDWTITVDSSLIRAHNLFLAHPGEGHAPLIDHISLKIAEGEKVGFISKAKDEVPVFLRLLSGKLEADRGIVWLHRRMIDGDQSSSIGWFSERATLIDGSLRENICLDRKAVYNEEQISFATKLAGLDQLENFEKDGLDLPLKESGEEISDEEKVRIFMARSLIHKPDVLIFDAPRSEACFQLFHEILRHYLAVKDCTLLLGAKHDNQLDLTNRTVVLKNGKISMDGPTAEIAISEAKQPAANS